jgi:hypothetical protein
MPNSAEHKEKAERNLAFLKTIDYSAAPEWAAIVSFYAALHLVERLCSKANLHHDKHQDRLSFLAKHQEHKRIHPAFAALYDASMIARYGTMNGFRKAFPGNVVVDELIKRRLFEIEQHVLSHFVAVGSQSGLS